MTHSQNREDELVAPWLPVHGSLLDIGASDGVQYSNSRHFLLAGWSGVLFEPHPDNFAALLALYADRTDILLRRAAVVTSAHPRPTVTFSPARHIGLGSCLDLWPEHRRKWGPGEFIDPIEVTAVSVNALNALDPVDLVSLDIEGGNLAIAAEIEWARLCNGVAIIEHDGQDRQLAAIMGPAFRLMHRNGENAIFRRI